MDSSLGVMERDEITQGERGEKNKNRRAEKKSGREVDRNRNPLRQKGARETEK